LRPSRKDRPGSPTLKSAANSPFQEFRQLPSFVLWKGPATSAGTRNFPLPRWRQVFSLSRGALSGIDSREIAMPVMRDLVARTRLTCHLAILDGSEAVYSKGRRSRFYQSRYWVGRRMCVHTTSVGKALAAYLPTPRVQKILDTLAWKNARRIASPHGCIFKELERIRDQGYALDNEENSLGARCFGVPIFNQSDEVEASLGVSGTVGQVNPRTLPQLVDDLKDAAWRISAT